MSAAETYWVVYVKLPGDEHGTAPSERRFKFHGVDENGVGADVRAAKCRENALEAGLEARTQQVMAFKGTPAYTRS